MKTYKFGIKVNKENKKIIDDILFSANRYYNDNIAAKQENKKSFVLLQFQEENIEKLSLKKEDLSKELDNLYLDAKKVNSSNRKRGLVSDENKNKILSLKKEKANISKQLFEEKEKFNEILKIHDKEFNELIELKCFQFLLNKLNEEKINVLKQNKSFKAIDTKIFNLNIEENRRLQELNNISDKIKFYHDITGKSCRPTIKKEILNLWKDNIDYNQLWVQNKLSSFDLNENIKKIRNERKINLNVGTYLLIEGDLKKAKHFKKFNSCGRIGIQRSNNLKLENNKIAIITNENKTIIDINFNSSLKNKEKYVNCEFILNENKDILKFSTLFHRQLNGELIQAYIIVSKKGLSFKYNLCLIVEDNDTLIIKDNKIKIGLDPGWRILEDGSMRIATCYNGIDFQEIKLSEKFVSTFKYIEDLQSISDNYFNSIKLFIANNKKDFSEEKIFKFKDRENNVEINRNFSEEVQFIHNFKSHQKLRFLIKKLGNIYLSNDNLLLRNVFWDKWKRTRLKNNEDLFGEFSEIESFFKNDSLSKEQIIFMYLDFWRRKDEHLEEVKLNLSRKQRDHRLDFFKKIAYDFSLKYDEIFVDIDAFNAFAKKPSPEKDGDAIGSRKNRTIAAPSYLYNAFENKDIKISKIDPKYTSQSCPNCKYQHKDNRNGILFKCLSCNYENDADRVGAINIYNKGLIVKNNVI